MQPELPDDRDKPTPQWTRPLEPPIHRAARKGDTTAMAALLAQGADINERANLEHDNGPHLNGLTPLMVAARSIDGATVETLRWLVEHGADIHAESDGGNTAAWYAAGHGARWAFHAKAITPDHVERLRYLLDLGLDPKECNFIGRSLITEACEAGDPGRVALLLERGAPSVTTDQPSRRPVMPQHITAMLEAQGIGSQADAPIGTADSHQIPLFCTARSGSAECVNLILATGADPNTRDSSGGTALMAAGSAAVVRLLLDAGAHRDATDSYGKDAFETILEGSCDSRGCGPERFEVAHALIEAGIDIERVDQFGKTRLASAAFGHRAESIEFLLRLGARPDVRDPSGDTPLHSICWQGEYDNAATNNACEQIIRSLVAAGIPVDATNHRGQTAMHEAAGGDWGNPTAIRTLLALGARVDTPDNGGTTPLMIAATMGETACIKLLRDAGADPLKHDELGHSALDLAASHLEGWRGIVATGPNVSDAEREKKLIEERTQNVGGSVSATPPDLSSLLQEQKDRHADALVNAQEALEVLKQAAAPPIPREDRSERPTNGP
ncbi:MAG: ankyrin repeat domain-containing protein [Planctomycetota bacterium]|nr:ankyrin repeat domain-containing protein [Planctomycetota bacterium]